MKALLRISILLVLGLLTTACYQLEGKLEPLPQEQLNMRLLSHDFSRTFYSLVEQTADQILALESQNEQHIYLKSNALMWKINAEQALQRTIFQASPVAAMVDTWAFTAQMSDFYDTGAGKGLFGEQQVQVVMTSKTLETQFEETVKSFLSESDFKNDHEFIKQYVQDNPLSSIAFNRKSAFNDWLKFREINKFEAVTTFGSMPEVMSNISDRMAMISEQMPKILGWKAELYALHSRINGKDIQATLIKISEISTKFQKLMAQSPMMMQSLAVDMQRELSPLLQQLSDSTGDKLNQLSAEHQALKLMVKNERLSLKEMVSRKRITMETRLNEILEHTVEVVFQELAKTLKSLILYFVLFLVVIFFAPLGFGIWLGKRMQSKKRF